MQSPRRRMYLFYYDNLRGGAVTASVGRFGNQVSSQVSLFAVIEHGWLLAEAIQEVFVRKTRRLSPEIGSVSIGTKRDQISGKALPALHAMANKGHRKTQLQSCPLTNVRE